MSPDLEGHLLFFKSLQRTKPYPLMRVQDSEAKEILIATRQQPVPTFFQAWGSILPSGPTSQFKFLAVPNIYFQGF